MDMIKWLEEWYISQCNEDWEHIFGIKIDTVDNPGWHVQIDIEDTELEEKGFDMYRNYINDKDWVICQVKDKKFNGGGDPTKLNEIIRIFKEWVEM